MSVSPTSGGNNTPNIQYPVIYHQTGATTSSPSTKSTLESMQDYTNKLWGGVGRFFNVGSIVLKTVNFFIQYFIWKVFNIRVNNLPRFENAVYQLWGLAEGNKPLNEVFNLEGYNIRVIVNPNEHSVTNSNGKTKTSHLIVTSEKKLPKDIEGKLKESLNNISTKTGKKGIGMFYANGDENDKNSHFHAFANPNITKK